MRRLQRYTSANSVVAMLILLVFALLSFERFHAAAVRDTNADLERCMRVFRELLKQKGTGFRIQNGKLLVGNYVINGNFEVPDKVQEIFGETATVFMRDTRVSTNVRREDGSRAVGTRLEGAAYDAVFRAGTPYRGEANILGVPYFTAYDPIRGGDGKIIGALYVGMKKSDFLGHYAELKAELLLIMLGLLAVFTTYVFLFDRLVKKAENIRESDHRFLQTLVDTIPNPVFYKDVQGKYIGCNKAFEEYTGLPREELIGKSVFDIAPPHLAQMYHDADQELFQKQGVQVYEASVMSAGGITRDVIYCKATFPASDGSPGGLIGTMLDITERKQAEEKLRESQRYLADIIQFFPDATMVIDREGKVVAWNRAMEDLSGVKAEEMAGRGEYEYALPFYGKRRPILIDLAMQPEEVVEKNYAHIERRGNTLIGEAYIHNARGELLYFHGTAAALRNSNGEIIGAIESIRDFTERKKTEESLAEKDRLLSGILDGIQDGICLLDEDLRIVRVNPFFEQYYSAEMPFIGRKCYEVFFGRTEPCERCPSLRTLQSGEPAAKIFSDNKSGEAASFELVTFPLFDQGMARVTGVIEYVRNITERTRMEEELCRAKDAADEANRLKSEFLANMSHEIRTPMNGVIGMTELLLDTELTREQGEYARAIYSSAESLLTVINDILDFSKIEAQKLELEPIDFSLRDSIGDILQTLAVRAAEKGLELAYHIPPDVPDAVVGDPGRLRQIIINLVGNAIKFTERGEVVVFVVPETEMEEAVYLHFAVADTGIGILAEQQKRIFEAFSQADASTTRRYGGTGLGLTISARLVELMHGRIWVESEIGKGSAFHFTVCLGVRKGPVPRQLPETPGNLHGLRVLVVDDNATNRRILEEMLRNWRMVPSVAESAHSALEMMAAAREAGEAFNMLLTDVNMPVMDGFEFVERIRQRPDLEMPTIMMLSSTGQRGDAARCRGLGVSAYLIKPIKQSALLDAITTVFGTTQPPGGEVPLVTQHLLREARYHLRVLLAEDNPINRKIAAGMLEKRGHTVIAAENGREVLALLEGPQEKPFDLVLMDVQMPEMDGLEAAAHIREKEQGSEKHIPIVALTAHAMEGDREACLQAGMDGYVSKPLRAEDLLAAIEEAVKDTFPVSRDEPEAVCFLAGEGDAFDREDVLARVDGDWELFREVVGLFLADSAKTMAEIRDAVAEESAVRLNRTAHTLKGAVSNFGAGPVFELALKLEMMGKGGDFPGAREVFAALEKEMERLRRSLAECAGGTTRENPDRRG